MLEGEALFSDYVRYPRAGSPCDPLVQNPHDVRPIGENRKTPYGQMVPSSRATSSSSLVGFFQPSQCRGGDILSWVLRDRRFRVLPFLPHTSKPCPLHSRK